MARKMATKLGLLATILPYKKEYLGMEPFQRKVDLRFEGTDRGLLTLDLVALDVGSTSGLQLHGFKFPFVFKPWLLRFSGP